MTTERAEAGVDGRGTVAAVRPRAVGRYEPLGLGEVRVDGGFWADRQRLNRDAIIPHCDEWLERAGWVENFRAAVAGTLPWARRGRLFTDSDVYKHVEALVWEAGREPAPSADARIRELTALFRAVAEPDGYLNTFYGRDGQPDRYSDLAWGHELYCYGHLIQAAVARARTSGPDDDLVALGVAVADHVCATFADGANPGLCGHPEIETALVELYRVTGERRYLEQARLFVERRGHDTLGDTMYGGAGYYQDRRPIRELDVFEGHAVRALYLAAGAVDVAVETGDTELLDTVRRQYDRTLARRTYLTGGMGSHHHGETYGADFELPADRAYAETCAAVASVMLAWRLLLATGDERYADVVERALYNVVATCPADDGRGFHYVNTLHRRAPSIVPDPDHPSLFRTGGMRSPWFTTSCCPTNVARLLASLGGYLATTDAGGVQLHQYAAGTVTATLPDGTAVRLTVATRYPDDGVVAVTVDAADRPVELSLRVPGWADGATLRHGAAAERAVAPGRATVTVAAGDEVVLTLPLAPRLTVPDPRIDAVRGCVAVERGPVVYCAESVDQPDVDLDLVAVAAGATPVDGDGVVELAGTVAVAPAEDAHWPYDGAGPRPEPRAVTLRLTPYHSWGNRGPSTMRVWLPSE